MYHDVRNLVRRVAKEDSKETLNPEINIFNLSKELYEEAIKYPKNLTIKHFIRFLCAPTCCYQLIYPSTKTINKSFALKRFLEFIISNFIIV